MPVEAICGLYRRFGYDLLLVTATVESADDLRNLVAAIAADGHVVVGLHAEPETLRRRIIEREPETFAEPHRAGRIPRRLFAQASTPRGAPPPSEVG